ncbi:hypothetical protein L910_2034 [Vibrio fluvialis PG41]|uniref:Uncharacterized protein n=1 Tax=Vibrio fluvialis PG41 TaxID=1336752 RepID=S7I8V1_VIBFL|nr:hypothetical protein L910_2034 [Vibrio fluvialis PG41]
MTLTDNRSRQSMTVRRKAPNEYSNRFNLIPDNTEKGCAARFVAALKGARRQTRLNCLGSTH